MSEKSIPAPRGSTVPPAAAAHRPRRTKRASWIRAVVWVGVLPVLGVACEQSVDRVGEDPSADFYRTSVAVIPPVGVTIGPSDGTDPNALAEALANEISSVLSRVPWLKVIPFYSVTGVLGSELTTAQLLDTLKVEHLLRGELSLEGRRIRIHVGQRDRAGRPEDGQDFAIALDDWLDEQPRIAGEVAREFLRDVGGEDVMRLEDLPAQSPAQRDFLIGNRFVGQRTPAGIRRSIDAYWTAIEKDSTYAPAFAQLSSAYALAINYRYEIGMDEYTVAGLAEALATRAIELNPDGAAGWASRSYLRALAGAPTVNAAADIERARRLEPNNPSVPSWSARVHSLQGNDEEALAEAMRAAELDRFGPGRQFAVAYQAFYMGRYQSAVKYADIALDLEPDLMLPRVVKARALVLMGRPEQCLDIELGPHEGTRALCLWAMGDQERAQQIVDSLGASYGAGLTGAFTRITEAEDLAVFYAYVGNAALSLQWIERAYDQSPTGIELRVLESEIFDGVRNETGFQFTVNRIRGNLWERVVAAWKGPLIRPVTDG
jgi:eukaryotic-like serine/threonine-protein kinase